ncbi:SDR family NAD(P)-dependent oxidoreductase [Nostoc sp. ChiQUE01b]|uniref:SDR family NAD(P)-dependent oxidoreductase n=1 Tax=Nostoc sp. ChiQUE01b TaxID=3075376 RepID=UPI002AD305E5|nr:SDR family NAD(P)-dependent oxidoreductase [Nostoc sp. ChiQUE01b]MDZ8261973.1 SDR family NAD(P)-dependent oxidoreductase [Nostoc sp. ChiQUE01b]
MDKFDSFNSVENIAIIGMSGRFPGAKNVEEFWHNLQNGVESISFFSEEELESVGISKEVVRNPNYVKANAVLENIDLFDATFFGFNPKEAEITDPQHRIFLESVWEALEDAGYNTETYSGSIGLYAGADGFNSYFFHHLYNNHDLIESLGAYQVMIANQIDFLCSRVSYKLNLTGPSVTVQTACSTSLVATSMACQSLLCYECDIALAGGVSIRVPQQTGYLHQSGMIFSPDGHCRAFDAKAQGTVGGNGVGIVVLKRLSEAIADGDYIHAVIKGSAINNDGSVKVGYTAPSVDGQAAVIAQALANAEVEPETITYIEAHGTGTPLGDPIEIAALKQVFSAYTQQRGFCAIGSVKTNVGHLDTAAGIAGLIKTVCAIKHKMLPPSLHFEKSNPEIDFTNSPFYVNTKLCEWKTNGSPRRAGVSSFGIGGTNAHILLEEAPAIETQDVALGESRPWQLLTICAKTQSALDTATASLVKHFKQHPQLNLADAAYTLAVGRKAFDYRRILVSCNLEDAANTLSTLEPKQVFTNCCESQEPSIVFMFSGQGSQYVNMALELYKVEPTFQKHIDICSEILIPFLGLDLRQILYPHPEQVEAAAQQLQQTAITQPALFVIEYALAQLWMSWGVHPIAMIGHSIGEYVAACLAGVFSLEDALFLVAGRGQLMQQLPKGSMLAVPLTPEQVQPLIGDELSLAAINGPSLCVVSGPAAAVDTLEMQLAEQGVECRRLYTSHAFHSVMMEPILEPFTLAVEKIDLKPPQIPYVSNVTGTWVTADLVTEPSYWAKHLRHEVRFADGLQQLLKEPNRILLEIGPGRTLSTLANQHPDKLPEQIVLASLRHPHHQQSDVEFLLSTLGKLWLAGMQVDWSKYYTYEQRHRIPLPTYPFERQRYWIEPQTQVNTIADTFKKQDIADWFYIPKWKCSRPLAPNADVPPMQHNWVVFTDECGLGCQIVKQLELQGQDAIAVKAGSEFRQLSDRVYTINPKHQDDYNTLLNQLRLLNKTPKKIIHLWSVTSEANTGSVIDWVEKSQDLGFFSLLFLAQALGKLNIADELLLAVLTNNMQNVANEVVLSPEKATVLGPCRVISTEYPNIICRSIDIVFPQPETLQQTILIDQLLLEFNTPTSDRIIAYRDSDRWVQTFEPVKLDATFNKTSRLRKQGVYLITGGLGGIGLTLAEYLAQDVQAKLILTTRSVFPEKDEWQQWLATHDIQDETSSKIQKLQTIEKLGAEVLIVCADIGNIEQMQKVKTQIFERFGQIHGIIHTAGIAGKGIIQLKTQEIAEKVLAPKVRGTLLLDTLFKDIPLDFLILCSSLTAIVGEYGQVDYCAANAFLDAFAHHKTLKDGTFTASINWDSWQEIGMAATAVKQGNGTANIPTFHQKELKQGLLSAEGVDVFRRVLCSKKPQILVSTRDLQSQIERNNAPAILDLLNESQLQRPKTVHPRPAITHAYVAATNKLEKTIASVWEEFLGIEQVGIYDDFFELGGDSLLAVQLISKLRETLKIELSPHSLLDSPTVAGLATLIASDNPAKRSIPSSLVEIKPGSFKKPLFLIHPVGGHVYFYRDLANCFDAEQPVYGLQARGIEGEAQPLTQVEEIATEYIEALRTVQPEGPYFLGGSSFGGTLAFEMAQQLYAVGQKVELLAMIDTPGPGEIPPTPEDDTEILIYLLAVGSNLPISLEHLKQLTPDEQLLYFLNQKEVVNKMLPDVTLPHVQQLLHLFKVHSQAMLDYEPQIYPGKIIFFRASDRDAFNSPHPERGWLNLATEGVEIQEIPGNHITMNILPHVQVLADRLKTYLNAVE